MCSFVQFSLICVCVYIISYSKHKSSSKIEKEIVQLITSTLDAHNPFVKQYRVASSLIHNKNIVDFKLRLIGGRQHDGRTYNLPTASEVAVLVVGDLDEHYNGRNIIVHSRNSDPQRISELHSSYLPLQYPLLFSYGEDGYRDDIPLYDAMDETTGRRRVSMREFFAFRLMFREKEESVLLHADRLFLQFVVDAYTMLEAQRLKWIKSHQRELRVDLYQGLSEAVLRGETDPTATGKRVVLPSSFTGGARYMLQNYQDAMAICRWAGYPDIFLTFTCNPSWPEITRYAKLMEIKSSCRPDILVRVFKMKLFALMKIIKDEKVFGAVRAGIFQLNLLLDYCNLLATL